VGGARPPPFITFTITSKVAVCAPAECVDTLTCFVSSKICTLWYNPLLTPKREKYCFFFYRAVAGEQSARPDLAILASEEDLIAPASRDFAAGKKLILQQFATSLYF
jgi:hypothetical protein